MANGLGQTLRVALGNAVFKATNYTAPTVLYISLHTGDPGVDGGSASGNEVTGGSYVRKTTATSDWTTPTSANPSVVTTANALTFVTASANWGTITHFAIWSSSSLQTGAAFIASAALSASQVVNNGNTASFAAGAIVHQLQAN